MIFCVSCNTYSTRLWRMLKLEISVRYIKGKEKEINFIKVINKYNPFQFSVEISLKVNLFMWVEPIVAMFINERNMVGGTEQRLVNHIIFQILFCHLGIEFYFLFARGVMNDRGHL